MLQPGPGYHAGSVFVEITARNTHAIGPADKYAVVGTVLYRQVDKLDVFHLAFFHCPEYDPAPVTRVAVRTGAVWIRAGLWFHSTLHHQVADGYIMEVIVGIHEGVPVSRGGVEKEHAPDTFPGKGHAAGHLQCCR